MIVQPTSDPHTNNSDPPLNTSALLERCMGNVALVALLLDKFEEQASEAVVRIEQAIAGKDAGETTRVSHALKGAAGALSAIDVHRTATEIELAARENRLEAAAACFTDLKTNVDLCLAYLATARGVLEGVPSCAPVMGGER